MELKDFITKFSEQFDSMDVSDFSAETKFTPDVIIKKIVKIVIMDFFKFFTSYNKEEVKGHGVYHGTNTTSFVPRRGEGNDLS